MDIWYFDEGNSSRTAWGPIIPFSAPVHLRLSNNQHYIKNNENTHHSQSYQCQFVPNYYYTNTTGVNLSTCIYIGLFTQTPAYTITDNKKLQTK